MSGSLLRERQRGHHARVTSVELFFDLVFVFAITQLSHGLLHHLTLAGALETGLTMLMVWWAWIYTAWCTNWLDPERPAVRIMLFVLMGVGLVLSTSLPEAFGERPLVFAGAYVTFQLGRSLFMLWAVRGDATLANNFLRISTWLAVSGALWITGALSEDGARIGFWVAALAIEFAGPAAAYWAPGLGRSTTADWTVEGGHMAERCALFIIICLGESILVTGATFAELEWTPTVIAAFASALLGSIAMWWIYFSAHAEAASHAIAESDDPGRIARLAYTYMHIPLVAGIIVSAAGDELVLAHADGHVEPATAWVVIGGPLLYLLGATLFKFSVFGVWAAPRIGGVAALLVIAVFALSLTPLALTVLTTGVLILVAAAESFMRARQPRQVSTAAK